MPNVKILCICNQFDAYANIVVADYNDDTQTPATTFALDSIAEGIYVGSKNYKTNDIILLGDNKEYLKGIREIILSDYALNYANENINITILGE